ncbi:uncharacterized protein TNCV_3021731 [Trichonephila clavipes]|nr:uncharacterized protein TNCV_3021731 [Trichonephila clavipes]
MIPAYNKRDYAVFHSRRKSIPGESPTSFPIDTSIPYSGFEHEPTQLQAKSHSDRNLELLPHEKRSNLYTYWCCDSPVVKVSDIGRHVMSSSPVPLKTSHVGERCTLNLSRAQTSSSLCGVGVRRRGASSQLSSSSLDHGSKLRGPSPKALV